MQVHVLTATFINLTKTRILLEQGPILSLWTPPEHSVLAVFTENGVQRTGEGWVAARICLQLFWIRKKISQVMTQSPVVTQHLKY